MANGAPSTGGWPAHRVWQWATIAVLLVISEAVSWAGHPAASYGVDGLAIAAWVGFWLWRGAGRSAGDRRPDRLDGSEH